MHQNLTDRVNNLHYEKFQDGTVKCIEDEIPFEVPEGWEWSRLNSIVDVRDGTHDTPTYVDKGIPLITSKNLVEGGIDYSNVKYISEKDAISINERSGVNIGDILFAMIGTIGNPSMITKDILISIKNVALFKFTFSKNLSNHFVMYFLDYAQEDMKNKPSGGLQPFVSLNFLRTYLVPVPPVEEQQRIVSILADSINKIRNIDVLKNELTASVEKAKSKILDLAIRGKLVPQDPNDEPASVLLERIRTEKEELIKQGKIKRDKKESVIFKGEDNSYYERVGDIISNIDDEIPFELPQNWEWSRLQTICYPITDGTHKTPTYSDSGYIFLSAKNITTGKINWNDIMYIPKSLHDELYSRVSPKMNDILLAKNGTTGVAAIVDRECEFDIYVTLALLRVVNNNISSQYLLKIIASDTIQDYFKSSLKGIGVPNLHLEHIRTTLIPIPPINEQNKIAERIYQYYSLLDSIVKNIE